MLPRARWVADPYDVSTAARLQAELDLQPATTQILARRGFADPAEAAAFLTASVRVDPRALPGIGEAVREIEEAVEAGTRIAVFGDYDVDGVCSTAMMISALRRLGADPLWRLPAREEGYGLTSGAICEFAAAGVGLLITVDCGITAVDEVEEAQAAGMKVIVTDHHRPGEALPDCTVVHPGDAALCAAGVVLKLGEALTGDEHDLDLAGLATVCDMVPLVGENRRIAREGLAALARTRRPGLRALMAVAALEPGDIDEHTAGFRLGPRINAAGRLQRADAALELLLTESDERARKVAEELDGLNHDRREAEQRILREAEAMCAAQMSAAALVVAGEGWHPGVVGIVASRLVERFGRPAVVIALEGPRGRGSARSIDAYDLHEGLGAVSEQLERFGGHRMAAGLEIETGAVDAFRAALAAHAGERLAPADLQRTQRVDAVVSGADLTLELAEELARLGPFGQGNPAPVLLTPAARVEHVTAMGEDRQHARFSIVSGGARARGVAFRTSQRVLAGTGSEPHDVAVSLERNRWNGAEEARVVLRSLWPTEPGRLTDVAPEDFGVAFAHDAWFTGGSPACRELADRRGEGLAALSGELRASGEPFIFVVADVERRRRGLEALGGGDALAWAAIDRHEADAHLLVLDPPPVRAALQALRAKPGEGLIHLAWGRAEADFALRFWTSQLDLRAPLAALWRELSEQGELDAQPLRGRGAFPRSGALCGRLARVLNELGLAEWDGEKLRAIGGRRTDLNRSPTHRASASRLGECRQFLTDPGLHSRYAGNRLRAQAG